MSSAISTPRPVPFVAWPLLTALWVGCAFAAAGYWRYGPPEIPAAAVADDSDEFSFSRVERELQALVGDGIPHPAGTAQNAVVRQRIIDSVAALGLQVEQHVTSGVARRTGETFPLVNLLVYLPGSQPTATIAVTSHHDSTPAGPGAADNAAAVAISLELIRYYHRHPPKNNLLFLITDGEELGLLGAEKFVREHPLAATLEIVINLEARGTSGPSCMFETGPSSHWAIQHFAAVAQRPIASSLFYEVYRLLPNNTDFTRYRELPIEGWNFAFVGSVLNYHTPRDNVATVDRRSVHHHALHAQGLLARFANAEDVQPYPGAAVYFDYLGLGIVSWWHSHTIYWAILPTLVLGGGWWRCVATGRASWLHLLGVSLWLVLVTLGVVVVLLTTYHTLEWQDYFSPPWPKYPLVISAVFWTMALAVSLATSRVVASRPVEVYMAVVGGGFLLLWLTILYVPGASYLFLLPAGVAAAGAWVVGVRPTWAALAAWAAVAALWLPLEPLFYDALGFMNRDVLVARLTLLVMAAYPVCVGSWPVASRAHGSVRPVRSTAAADPTGP